VTNVLARDKARATHRLPMNPHGRKLSLRTTVAVAGRDVLDIASSLPMASTANRDSRAGVLRVAPETSATVVADSIGGNWLHELPRNRTWRCSSTVIAGRLGGLSGNYGVNQW